MATIVLRLVKGTKLTKQQADDNWNNINVEVEAATAAIIVNADDIATNVTNIANKVDKTTATAQAVASTLAINGDITIASGSIVSASGAITFDNENLSTTGTLAAGTTTIGTLVLAAASITDTTGAISFGNENLSTTGTLASGALTVTGAATITGTLGVLGAKDLGIGMHIKSGDSGVTAANLSGDELVIEGSGNAGMHIMCPDLNVGIVYFGTPSNESAVRYKWDYTNDTFTIGTNHTGGELAFETAAAVLAMTIASDGDVGMGESVPLGKLHIKTSDAGSIGPPAQAKELILESNSDTGMIIYSGNASTGRIVFGDVDLDVVSQIVYNHASNSLSISVNGISSQFVLSSNNRVGLGVPTPLGKLHVDQLSTTGAEPVLYLDQGDLSEEFIYFAGTEGTGNSVEAVGAKTLTTTKFLRVNINGTYYYLQAGTIA